ncbi:hypothetical protein C8Q77DRAFT_823749 [Trametes polyzona]|nr:hypothetical protein C8Q77DRAFT_823749 [Trametes polyzona]
MSPCRAVNNTAVGYVCEALPHRRVPPAITAQFPPSIHMQEPNDTLLPRPSALYKIKAHTPVPAPRTGADPISIASIPPARSPGPDHHPRIHTTHPRASASSLCKWPSCTSMIAINDPPANEHGPRRDVRRLAVRTRESGSAGLDSERRFGHRRDDKRSRHDCSGGTEAQGTFSCRRNVEDW